MNDIRTVEEKLAAYNTRLEQVVAERTAQLQRINNRMTAVLNNLSNPVLLLNADGTIDIANQALLRKLDYGADELFNVPVWTLFGPPDCEKLTSWFHHGRDWQQTDRFHAILISKHGQTFDVEAAIYPIKGDDNQLVCTLYDISHLKEMERVKDEFIAMITHELHTPIASIMLSTETMTRHYDRMTDAQKQHKLIQITQQAKTLADLVSSILDISRMDSRVRDLAQTPSDMSEALHDVAMEIVPQAEAKHQTVEFSVVPGQMILKADYKDLTCIWRNLLVNAVKYTGEGGRISATVYGAGAAERDDHTPLRAMRHLIPTDVDTNACIIGIVEDNGHGIHADNLSKLFTRFYRGWASTTNIAGTGLGLALIRDLLRLYNGDIAVSSELGVGTTFFFWLPAAPLKGE